MLFNPAQLEPAFALDGKPRHFQPVAIGSKWFALVRRTGGRHEQHPVQPQLPTDFVDRQQMSEVNRIERPTEHAEPGPHFRPIPISNHRAYRDPESGSRTPASATPCSQ